MNNRGKIIRFPLPIMKSESGNGFCFRKLKSQIFDKSKQIHNVDNKYQPKMKDNLPGCLKAE